MLVAALGAASGCDVPPSTKADPPELTQSAATFDHNTAWDELCSDGYFNDLGIQTPWEQNNRLGIDLSNVTCADLRQEWEIYQRRVAPSDVALAKSAGSLTANVYFSLYNRRVGVMRTFIWIDPSQDANGSYYSVRLDVADGAQSRSLDHFLFSYEGAGKAFTHAERTDPSKNADRLYLTTEHSNSHWIVEDTHLSYDPFPHDTPLYLRYYVMSHDVGQIKLTGKISEGRSLASKGAISTAVDVFKSTKAGFSKGKATYEGMVSGVQEIGYFITNELGDDKRGQDLLDIAAKAARFGTGKAGLGLILGGSNLVTGVLGWLQGSQSGFSSSIISLDGTLTFLRGVTMPQVPLANSGFIEAKLPQWARTYRTPVDRNLGLYGMSNRPRAKIHVVETPPPPCVPRGPCPPQIYTRRYYLSIEDPHCYLYVNPATGAKTTSIAIKPMARFGTFGGQDFPEEFQPWDAWARRQIGPTRTVFPNKGVLPPIEPITLAVKIDLQLDVGRGEVFEGMNTYDVRDLTIKKVGALPAGFDFGSCTKPEDVALGLEVHDRRTFWQSGPNWYLIDGAGFDGDAVASGHIGDGQVTTLSTTFVGSSYAFDWRVSSEAGYDILLAFVDEELVGEISGETGWTTVQGTLPFGEHEVQWQYIKDSSLRAGEDRGFVDHLVAK
jgi:hypothetical protein